VQPGRTTAASTPAAAAPSAAAARAARIVAGIELRMILLSSTLQRRVDDREPLLALLKADAGDAKQAAQLVVGDLQRPGRGRRARRRLRKRRGARGVEGDVAFHLLHDLMDMAVEDGHRTEALEVFQDAAAIFRAPAPIRINAPERDVGEDHDGCRSRTALDVGFEPFELLVAEVAESARLEIDDIDEADKMHAVGVEAIPAGTLGAAPVALAIKLQFRVEEVMLAGDVMNVEPRLRDNAVGVVELRFLR